MSVDKKNFWSNTWFGDAAVFGRYPEDGLKLFGAEAPTPKAGDMELIGQKLDFYGVNIYSGNRVKAGADGKAVPVWLEQGHARNALNWAVAPEALRWGPRFVHERYKLPVLVTENGMTNLDWVHSDGAVHDPQRIDFTRRYLMELRKAIDDGADIRGYFHWSIMDNFEWAEGYKDRFGLIHVDYATQKRTLKDSAHWYAEVIASNGAILDSAHAGLEKSVFVYEGLAV
jgi:beta-glucosidase